MGSLRPDTLHPPSRSVSPVPSATSPAPATLPSNDDIEAIIQLATSSSSSVPQKDTRTQLFVGNLPYRVRWQDLKDLFRKAGTVLRADVSLGPDNRSRGYGTVLLASAEDAGRAIDMFNGYSWQTRVLEVRLDRLPVDLDSLAPPTGTGTPSSNMLNPYSAPSIDDYAFLERPSSSGGGTRSLFVGNLPFHCQWQDLKDLFRQAGTILRADVALGPDGRSRGFGTVSFATEADAERAVNMFNGYEYNGRQLKVHYDRYSQSAASAQPLVPTSPLPFLHQPSSSLPHSPLPHSQVHSPLSLPHSPHPPSLSQHPSFQHLASGHFPSPLHRQISEQELGAALDLRSGQSEHDSNQQALEGLGRPTAIPMPPPGYQFEFINSSAPSSPFGHPGMYMVSPGYMQPQPQPQPMQQESARRSPFEHGDGSPSSQSLSSSNPSTSSTNTATPTSPMKNHHPGPIALPPPLPLPLPHHLSPMHHPMSPQATHVMTPGGMVAMTPAGLPPITPSMPSFNFAYAQQGAGSPMVSQVSHPPPAYMMNMNVNMLSPPMFSPGLTMSPGTPVFWAQGRAPINPAVGAPVHNSQGETGQQAMGGEPASYFPPVSAQVDYFWGAGVGGTSGLRNEVGGGEERGREGAGIERPETERSASGESGVTTSASWDRAESSSVATSWGDQEYEGELAEKMGGMGLGGEEGPVNGGGAMKHRTTSMNEDHPRRPAPGPVQGHRADSDPIHQVGGAEGDARKGHSEDQLQRDRNREREVGLGFNMRLHSAPEGS